METTSGPGHSTVRIEAVERWLEATKDEGDDTVIPVSSFGPFGMQNSGGSSVEMTSSAFSPACCGNDTVVFETF